MNKADREFLASLRIRARNGEEFNPTLLALYQGLEARDARDTRESGKHFPSFHLLYQLSLLHVIKHVVL